MKKIDYYVGLIILIMIFPLIKLKYYFFKICKNFFKFKKRIIFIKLLGGGSLFIAYPSILAVKERYENYELILLCSKEVSEYAKLLNLFDRIEILRKFNTFNILYFILKIFVKHKFSEYICNLEFHSRLCFALSNLLLPDVLISLNSSNRNIENHFSNRKIFYNPNNPIFEGYDSIAYSMGATNINVEYSKQRFQKIHSITSHHPNDSLLGIAPFCSKIYKERQFSPEEIVAVIKRNLDPDISEIRIYGGPGDIELSNLYHLAIKREISIRVVNYTGRYTLRELIPEINSIKKLITIDSGVNHLARLSNVSIVSYWGPSDPYLRLREVSANETTFYNKISCSPCVHLMDQTPCRGLNICMTQHLKRQNSNIVWLIK